MTLNTIKKGVLLFWAAWFAVVCATNLLDAARALGALPESFAFVSGNWAWINATMDPLAVPRWLQAAQFGGVIVWEGLCAVLFARAFRSYSGRPIELEAATITAFVAAFAFWATFQILDEVFKAYSPESVHRVIFGNLVISLVALWIPARRPKDIIEE